MNKLAILGGDPVLNQPLALFNRIGEEEQAAVEQVLKSGCLSGFVGAAGTDFKGGPCVKELEIAWREKFNIKHAISVNSASSGLFSAVGAAGIGPGDEVIVTPYTMSATVMAPLVYGGIPVFADIETETFCIDPECVKKLITDKTRAIIAVNLFGHPARLQELKTIANESGLVLIEDNAQSPLAKEGDFYAGTIGDIGIFSLNRHKHIQAGEGGICVTNDDELALRLELIRNHGENLVDDIDNIANLIGFNYRLTEIGAAIGLCQLNKLDDIIDERKYYAENLTKGLSGLPGINFPVERENCRHVYYVWALRYDEQVVGVSRSTFAQALCAEGFPVNEGYVKPLYMLPIFQKRIGIGKKGFPFTLSHRNYSKGLCPIAENMHYQVELGFGVCTFELSEYSIKQLISAFYKVYEKRKSLHQLEYSSAS